MWFVTWTLKGMSITVPTKCFTDVEHDGYINQL